MDSGPQDRQHGAVSLGSQKLESGPLVLRRFRSSAHGSTAAAEDPETHATERCSEAVVGAEGARVEVGEAAVGCRC